MIPSYPALRSTLALVAALTLATACGDDDDDDGTPGPGPTPDVSIVSGASTLGDEAYDPSTFTVSSADGEVVWSNDDNVVHTVTADDDSFDSGTLAAGDDFTLSTLPEVGTYPYHCTIHPGMVGTLVVTD